MGKVVKSVVKVAAPIVGGVLGGPAGAAIGSAVSGMIDQRDQSKAAKALAAGADALGAQQLALAEEQYAFQKGNIEADRKLAAEDYARRLGIVDDLMAAATYAPEFYSQQIGGATAAVRTNVDQAMNQELRTLSRYGVNPNSGRFASTVHRYGLQGAALEAAAANSTRQALGAEERARQDQARAYGLSVMPTYVGTGASNPAIDVLGAQYGIKLQQAAAREAQANQSRSDLLGVIGGAIGQLF